MSRGYREPRGDAEDNQWVFPWWRRNSRLRPILLPVGLAGLVFLVLLGLIQVKVGNPQFEMERKGSLVYLPGDGDGLAWAIRAREFGPELSRYEPATWSGYRELELAVTAATAMPLPSRTLRLRQLPVPPMVRMVELAAKGVPTLPARDLTPVDSAPLRPWRLVPVLDPLSPLGAAAMPESLPPMAGEIDPKMAEIEWRFVLQLRADGSVDECLALTKNVDGEEGVKSWLKTLTFDPRLALQGGWFAVAVRFNNQTDDETDDH